MFGLKRGKAADAIPKTAPSALSPENAPDPAPKVIVTADGLDAFCERIEKLGGHHHPDAAAAMAGFQYQPTVKVDTSLDPFSDDYFNQMVALYEEISGRSFDIEDGEQHPINVTSRVNTPNPYGTPPAHFIAMHSKAVMAALEAVHLPPRPKVLDLGSGWGLSSELIAFTGAKVTAVDINPLFCDLVAKRAERLNLPISAVHSQFDTLDLPDRDYDFAFFYECLHHAPKPWETLAKVAEFLKPGGAIGFCGEPLTPAFWPNWGIRLDYKTIYVVRRHGWFESGWSAGFLKTCFDRVGFDLEIIHKIGLRGGPVGVARRK